MKSLDLEWVLHNWGQASEEDRDAAGKEMRKRLRGAMTQLEGIARGLKPLRGDPLVRMSRIKELRAQGVSLQDAVVQLRDESAGMAPYQPEGWPAMRQQIRDTLDELVDVVYQWSDRCPDLEPAWTQLESRALDLHTGLRLDDGEMNR
jgi:hypothetical protein